MPSTRRRFLFSTAAVVALAGCSTTPGSPEPDDPPEPGVADLPEPDRHVFGANGSWSSFGCNAANTREVGDGEAPVDGISERWRVEVPETAYQSEPVVADGRVYHVGPRGLRVFDAGDGAALWTDPDAVAAPLVRDGVAYVPRREAVRAVDAGTGDRQWERRFETPGRATTPATYDGEELVCGAGERVVALDAASGDLRWERDVFGQVLDHVAFSAGFYAVVATEAGMVYLLGDGGTGGWKWQLPARPTCPPTAGRDSIFVNCRDGRTYALESETDGSDGWDVDTGWAEHGIGLVDSLVVLPGKGALRAFDADSGEQRWQHGIGDWRHTAPAVGRDTVFVGGDRLRALDPTPGGDPDGGPSLRFEREFAGRVGPGPVLDDGTLYVIAEVEADEYALLALE